MAEIDGFELLAAIGKNPAQFRSVKVEVNKNARAWFTKVLKQEDMTLSRAKELRKIAGENFHRIVGGLPVNTLRSTIKSIDEFYAGLKMADQATLFRHVIALVDGDVNPATPPPAKAESKGRSKKTSEKNTRRLDSEFAAQIGKDADDRNRATRKSDSRGRSTKKGRS
jgi:hypothetical protein